LSKSTIPDTMGRSKRKQTGNHVLMAQAKFPEFRCKSGQVFIAVSD
jgi:hypothetical protein